MLVTTSHPPLFCRPFRTNHRQPVPPRKERTNRNRGQPLLGVRPCGDIENSPRFHFSFQSEQEGGTSPSDTKARPHPADTLVAERVIEKFQRFLRKSGDPVWLDGQYRTPPFFVRCRLSGNLRTLAISPQAESSVRFFDAKNSGGKNRHGGKEF